MVNSAKIALITYFGQPKLTDSDKLLLNPLEDLGFNPQPVVWDSPKVDWSIFSCVIIRCCWDYHYKYQQFLNWIDQLEKLKVRVWNPLDLVRWNSDKHYLKDLQDQGVAIIPTVWVDKGDKGEKGNLKSIFHQFNTDNLIIKPTIGASSYEVFIANSDNVYRAQSRLNILLLKADMMIQPFIEAIWTEGEYSFVFINRKFSHAVLKRPKKGDFRAIPEFGGTEKRVNPDPKLLDQVKSILNRVKSPLLYARVDGIIQNGKFLLMELELIEPHLFFDLDEKSPLIFAGALKERFN